MGLMEDIQKKKEAKKNLVSDLANVQTLDGFFDTCRKHFNTEETFLGTISKNALINNIDKIIDLTGAKPRK